MQFPACHMCLFGNVGNVDLGIKLLMLCLLLLISIRNSIIICEYTIDILLFHFLFHLLTVCLKHSYEIYEAANYNPTDFYRCQSEDVFLKRQQPTDFRTTKTGKIKCHLIWRYKIQ